MPTEPPTSTALSDGADGSMLPHVKPYYVKMMRLNGASHGRSLIQDIVRDSNSLTARDVVGLLRGEWRARVMGAWYAVCIGGPEVVDAVLRAVRTSRGSLDAPPLATAAVVLAGPQALPALEHYYAADAAGTWGAGDVVAAAVDHLRVTHELRHLLTPPPTEQGADAFRALLDVAGELQAARATALRSGTARA